MGNDASKMMNEDINNRGGSSTDLSKTMADTQDDIEEFEQKIETFFSALAADGEDHLDYGKIISKIFNLNQKLPVYTRKKMYEIPFTCSEKS